MSTIRKSWKSAVYRGRPLRSLRLLAAALATVSTLCAAPVVQAAPGDIIENTAVARYLARSGLEEIRVSNIDNLVVARGPAGGLRSGLVFDSSTGLPVDGALITLVDESTGLPAVVFSADRTSAYPTEIESGADATDAAGVGYDFAPGEYLFPFLPPGDYRLLVDAPPGYLAPSQVAMPDLQPLSSVTFAIEAGSYGDVFAVVAGTVTRIDIPVDPLAAEFFMGKIALSDNAAIGDFVQYEVSMENTLSMTASRARAVDALPVGFRYVKDSLRYDRLTGPEPAITDDGTTLTFDMGDIPAGETVRIRYVAEVTASAPLGYAENVVVGHAVGATASNQAKAVILVREDLFQSHAFLVGSTLLGACEDDERYLQGVAGIRVFLEDGRYVVSDDAGMFHFEGVSAGTHVVQVDVDSVPEELELVQCDHDNTQAGRSYSRFLELTPGGLWRTDFRFRDRPSPIGAVTLAMTAELVDDMLDVELRLTGGPLPLDNLVLTVLLPEGARFLPDSVATKDAPQSIGDALIFRQGRREGDWSHNVGLRVDVSNAATEELRIRGVVTFEDVGGGRHGTEPAELVAIRDRSVAWDSFTLPTHFAFARWELSEQDESRVRELAQRVAASDDVQIELVGHTDNVRVLARASFADNYELSYLRARSVASVLAEELGLALQDMVVVGRGADAPVADNDTAVGRSQNRRVEVLLYSSTERVGSLNLDRASAYTHVEFIQTRDAVDDEVAAPPALEPPTLSAALAASQSPGHGFIYPPADVNPRTPTTPVLIKHLPGEMVRLSANRVPVSRLLLDGTETAAGVAVTAWRAVRLREGNNQLEAEILGPDGQVVHRATLHVHFSGAPVRVELIAAKSRLVADGRTAPVLAVQMYDRWSRRVRPGLIGEFHVVPPYRALLAIENARRQNGVIGAESRTLFRTNEEGIALIELKPTTNTGEAVVQFTIGDLMHNDEHEVRARLVPGERDWILVGLANGTAGYNSVSGRLDAIRDETQAPDYWHQGRVAFFAKGQIKGEYLLTVAYDSAKDRDELPSKLFGSVAPDRYYTVYGDGTDQRFDAASQEKLFLRIERETFYAMFGDFATGLTVTELGRYSRRFNGFKSERAGARFGYSAFAAKTDQTFVKDEIQGDGTSGLYTLSNRPVIINSESVMLETRDRFQGEEIITHETLHRHLDYNIDYVDGTLFFKRPVPSRDEAFNPVFIVVDYEVDNAAAGDLVAGARGTVKLGQGRAELGATVIHDGNDLKGGDLQSVDVKVRINETTSLEAELARSDSQTASGKTEAQGYRVEITHRGQKVDGRAYFASVDDGFGIGQQRGVETGMRKIGAEGRYHVTDRLTLEGETYLRENLVSGAERQLAELAMRTQTGIFTGTLGMRYASDEDALGDESGSNQFFAANAWTMMDGRVRVRGQMERALGSADNVDFPNRTLAGFDYALTGAVDVFLEHEFAESDRFDSHMTRAGLRSRPWSGGEFHSSVDRSFREDAEQLVANVGLTQRFAVGEHWAVDFSLDRAQTMGGTPVRFDDDQPPASGTVNNDFTAISAGSNYQRDGLTLSKRLEWRNGEQNDKWGLFLGVFQEPAQGRGMSGSFTLFDTRGNGVEQTSAKLQFGLAHRPRGSRWSLLERSDLIYERNVDGLGSRRGWRFVNNLNANYSWSDATQLSVHYGAKYVRTNFDAFSATGFTDRIAAGYRRQIHRRWDVGASASLLHSWNADLYEFQLGVELGRNLFTNTWLAIGYNFSGFKDTDFSGNEFTAAGPYATVRLKFDQDTVRQLKQQILGRAE